jgi:hypothetical protein
MSDMGLYCSLLGTSIGLVWPDVSRNLPMFQVRSPRGCYPVPKDQDGYELAYVIFYTKEPGRKAAKMLNKSKLADEDEVEIIQYLDDKEYTTLANGVQVESIKHKLGFCPALTIPNIGIPGSPFGESTVVLAVTLQKYLNYMTSMFFATAEEQFNQPIVLPDGARWPAGLPGGPRDVIELPEGATQQAYRLPPPSLPFDVFKIRDTLTEELSMVTDIPQAMLGGSSSPYLSGRSVTAQLGPVQALMNVRMETIFPAIRKVMWMAFKMMETMWPNEEHVLYGTQDVWGRRERAPFVETFTVEEFGGRYECLITMPSGVYFDEQAVHMEMIQDIQNQTLSKESYMQLSPFIKPGMLDMEKERIQREVDENVQQNIAAQQAAASPTTNNAPMGEPGQTAYGLEQGYVGETEPAPIPGGMEVSPTEGVSPMGNTPETGNTIDPVISQMVDLLRSVPKVKGQIYIFGEFLDPQYIEENSGEGSSPQVTVGLTDATDKATVSNFVKKTVPEVWGNMTFVVLKAPPDEPYIDASPGSQGYDVSGGEMAPEGAAPEGEIPPDEMEAMMQMMGGA